MDKKALMMFLLIDVLPVVAAIAFLIHVC